MFNKISEIWLNSVPFFDPIQRMFNGNFWQITSKRFIKYTTGQVLDLACGTGEFSDFINPKTYLGIDFNKNYVEFARKKRSARNRRFIVQDLASLKMSGTYDTAFIISAAHHFSDGLFANICQKLRDYRIKNLVVIDGWPTHLSRLLRFLDSKLGGGHYFRNENELSRIISPYYRAIEKGSFNANQSFYRYPYVIGKLRFSSPPK